MIAAEARTNAVRMRASYKTMKLRMHTFPHAAYSIVEAQSEHNWTRETATANFALKHVKQQWQNASLVSQGFC